MSHKIADRFADAWIDSLDEAMQAVEAQILNMARRRTNILKPEEFERWMAGPA
jgi:truncated hemoglobin YjbI